MKLHLIIIGNKFIYNKPLKEYILRKVEQKATFIDSIAYFKESDNSLFLHLEEELNSSKNIIIVTTKQHFSTIGKLICTVTSDNQVLNDNMLIPSKANIYEDKTYLLEYENSITNVLHVDEMQTFPEILMSFEDSEATLHLFDEDKETALKTLSSIAARYDVNIEMISIIDTWHKLEISSKKYGNISQFIHSAKEIMPNKLIASSSIVSYIIDRLSINNKKISFAESCTGGLLSYYFTSKNGASKVLDGALVTYSNVLKENWLGVLNSTLVTNGAVSQETVIEMSNGVINVSEADYAISISGIAGDGGGTELKPVGTVFVGIRTKKEHKEVELHLNGDRNYVQHQSVLFAIKMLINIDKDIFF